MSSAVRLVLFRLHQRSSPLHVRERAAAAAEALPAAPHRFALVSCHRVELYAALRGDEKPRRWLASELGSQIASLFGDDGLVVDELQASRHLFRVACGLDSAIRGEAQIRSQLRRSFDATRAACAVETALAELVRRALRIGRDVRTSTALGTVRRSIGSLAVEEAERLLPDAGRATALIIGAGEIGKLAARALRRRVGEILIANRDAARAAELASALGARAVPVDDLDRALAETDLVISAADTRGAILTRQRLATRLARGPLVLIDMAVPRSVDADARSLAGLYYRSVDDLGAAPEVGLEEAVAEAECRCEAAAREFIGWRRERESVQAVRALRGRAERLRQARLERALAKLRHLEERDRRVVVSLAHALTNELLHAPTVALRRAPERAAVALELFGVDE